MRGKAVLLVIDADATASREGRPQREYQVQQRLLGADLVDHSRVREHWLASRIAARLGMRAGLSALAAMRLRSYRVVYCDSESYGLLLALLVRLLPVRRPAVYFLAHWPTRPAKAFLLRRLGAHRGAAGIFVHASSLVVRLRRLGVPEDKLHLLPIAVDTTFWSPRGAGYEGPAYIASAGVEKRDYPVLVSALRELPHVRARLAASSPYSRHGNSLDGVELPDNVERVDCDTAGLRDVYECSSFVVVPVVESEINAGLTTIAEAMSMGKAVITSRAEGQSDTVVDRRAQLRSGATRATSGKIVDVFGAHTQDVDIAGPTGLYVRPGDTGDLREAMSYLTENPGLAQEMGARGRRVAQTLITIEQFAERTAAVMRQSLTPAGSDAVERPSAPASDGGRAGR